jgi:hypothetical protein
MRRQLFLSTVLGVALGACSAGATTITTPSWVPVVTSSPPVSSASLPPSPGFVLHPAPAKGGPACDAIGAEPTAHSLTFRIDPTAAEQVTALTDTGVTFTTYWSAGFQPGTATERVIRDPAGQVVVADGDVLAIPEAANPRLHGYLVVGCNGPNTLYVFLTDPVN